MKLLDSLLPNNMVRQVDKICVWAALKLGTAWEKKTTERDMTKIPIEIKI